MFTGLEHTLLDGDVRNDRKSQIVGNALAKNYRFWSFVSNGFQPATGIF